MNLNYWCACFKIFFFEETHLLLQTRCVRIKNSWRVFPLLSTCFPAVTHICWAFFWGGCIFFSDKPRRQYWAHFEVGPCGVSKHILVVIVYLGFLVGIGAEGRQIFCRAQGHPGLSLSILGGNENWGGEDPRWWRSVKNRTKKSINLDWNPLCDAE